MGEKKLLGLLQQKRGYFEGILDLTEEESLLSVPEWIANLEQKKVFLGCIEDVDREIHSYQAAFEELPAEIAEELDCIRGIVGKILHLDALNLESRKRQFHVPK